MMVETLEIRPTFGIRKDYAGVWGTKTPSEQKLGSNRAKLRSNLWEGPHKLASEEVRTAALIPTSGAKHLPLRDLRAVMQEFRVRQRVVKQNLWLYEREQRLFSTQIMINLGEIKVHLEQYLGPLKGPPFRGPIYAGFRLYWWKLDVISGIYGANSTINVHKLLLIIGYFGSY